VTRAVAIETSGRIGSIAVAADAQVIAEVTFPHGLQHAAQIVRILDEEVRQAGWSPAQIDHLYVSVGPGSFTGLRIAVTLAKTMSLATGVRLVAVPTVRVLVENAPTEARSAVIVLDAKRGQIFTSAFERSGGSDDWVQSEPAHLDTLAAMLARSPRPVHLVGEGIPYHRTAVGPGDQGVVLTPEESWRARASVVAKIGAQMAGRGEFADPLRLTPIYIRLPEAEEKWAARI
jgi:tRNA threonylcarbamoyladenosine biosynthesis protein TsaB